jgi:hypothetical protein
MEPKTQYLIVLLITIIITVFSIINFAYFLQIHNDDNPEVSKEAPIGLIVINGVVVLAGIIIIIYCIVKMNKSDTVEAKIFKHFRDDVSENKAVLKDRFSGISEPGLICDGMNSAVKEDGTVLKEKEFQNLVNGFQNLGLNIYEFVNECEAQGLIKTGTAGSSSGVKTALNNYNEKIISSGVSASSITASGPLGAGGSISGSSSVTRSTI